MRLLLPTVCQAGCDLCGSALLLDAQDLPAQALEARLEHAERTNQRRIYLLGTDLALHPHLPAVARSARSRSLEVVLVDDGPGLGLPAKARSLHQLGVAHVYLSLHGTPGESGEAAAPLPDSRKQVLTVLLAMCKAGGIGVGVHVPLGRRAARELPAVLRLQARLSIRDVLISYALADDGSSQPLDATAAVAALDRAWQLANALRLRLRFIGFDRTRHVHPPVGEPAPSCDSALLEAIRQGIPLPSPRAGVYAFGTTDHPSGLQELVNHTEDIRELGLELVARGCPFVDLPACLGGVQPVQPLTPANHNETFLKSDACHTCPVDDRCPGAPELRGASQLASIQSVLEPLPTWHAFPSPPRVLILSSQGEDPVFYVSTLPGLAQALRRRGAIVEIVSPWLSRWIPDIPPDVVGDSASQRLRSGQLAGWHPQIPDWKGTSGVEAWLEQHGLGGFDLVIASDFPTARLALAARSLSAAAHIVVLDFHMLKGLDDVVTAWLAPPARPSDGGWWPSEQLILESAFPAYVKLYRSYGIPLARVAWRPFALYPGHFSPGPNVHECDVIMSGGNHLRDLDTLRAATDRLPGDVHTVALYAPGERFKGNAHLRHEGTVPLPPFYRALANSRFVVLPLREETSRAAGVTVLAMALMAGRPVIASSIAAIRDYVRHGTDGLLVPPGDAGALADAITRLDTDPALLSALSEGARDAAQRLSTEHWAEQIMSGSGPRPPAWTPQGWRNW